MPLWLAVVLLIAALTGIALACKYLQKSRPARVLCIIGCVLLALACAVVVHLFCFVLHSAAHGLPKLLPNPWAGLFGRLCGGGVHPAVWQHAL